MSWAIVLLASVASAGDFAVSFGGNGFDAGPRASVTRDGSLLVVGTADGALFFGATEAVREKRALPYVLRVDPNGRAGARGRVLVVGEPGAFAVSAVELADGRVLVVGNTGDGVARFGDVELPVRDDAATRDSKRNSPNAFALWLDANGTPQRGAVTWGEEGEVTVTAAAALAASDDGAAGAAGAIDGLDASGAVVALWFDERVGASRSKGGTDGLVVALDARGTERWRAHVGGVGQDVVDSVTQLANGDVLVAGSTRETPTFTDGKGKSTRDRCGYPVHCPFLWRLDASTGATKAAIVIKNGSGYPSVAAVVPLEDGGFVVAGDMGRSLAVSSSTAKKTIKLRTESAVGHAYLARYDAKTNVVWARRADAKIGAITSALLLRGELIVGGFGDVGATDGVKQQGEGPATIARFSLDGAPRSSILFGKPDDAPLTAAGVNVRDFALLAQPDGRLAIVGSFEERMWLTLAQGPAELLRRDATWGQGNWPNTNDAFIAVVVDVDTLAKPTVPAVAGVDPIEGCVARKERSLLVPCKPVPRETRVARNIHHTCIEGTWNERDRRVWSCGALDDDVALTHEGRELIFVEKTAQGRLALYQDMASGHRAVTARLLDDAGQATWTRALEGTLRAKDGSWFEDVLLDVRDGVLYVLEACSGAPKQHRSQCDRIVALAPATGTTKWRSPNGVSSRSVVLVGEAWIVGVANGRIHLLDRATGKRVDSLAIERVGDVRAVPGEGARFVAVKGNFWDAHRPTEDIAIEGGKLVRSEY